LGKDHTFAVIEKYAMSAKYNHVYCIDKIAKLERKNNLHMAFVDYFFLNGISFSIKYSNYSCYFTQ